MSSTTPPAKLVRFIEFAQLTIANPLPPYKPFSIRRGDMGWLLPKPDGEEGFLVRHIPDGQLSSWRYGPDNPRSYWEWVDVLSADV
jgi:hypothetical protein